MFIQRDFWVKFAYIKNLSVPTQIARGIKV